MCSCNAGGGEEFLMSYRSDSFVVSADIDILDINTGQWNSTTGGAGRLSVARYLLAEASGGNKIGFAGGQNDSAVLATVDIYDVVTGTRT